jgi:predicted nucleic acid-binding Zn ribbon protein
VRYGDTEADLEDFEDPDEPDDDDDVTMPCPYCGKAVYDDAERCPSCGSYLSREDAPRRYAWWLLVGVVLGLLAVFLWVRYNL